MLLVKCVKVLLLPMNILWIFNLLIYAVHPEIVEYQLQSKMCKQLNVAHLVCDYIPDDVPKGTEIVTLYNVDYNTLNSTTLYTGHFLSPGWGNIFRLEFLASPLWRGESFSLFDSDCFRGLVSLKALRFSLRNEIEFKPDTFATLSNVTLLDLSGCRRLEVRSVVTALRGKDILPALRALNISMLNTFRRGISLDKDFFKVLYEKEITDFDVSLTQINFLNMTAFTRYCDHLVYVNFSSVALKGSEKNGESKVCPNLRYVDISYITLPTNVIPTHSERMVQWRNTFVPIFLQFRGISTFSNVVKVDASGVIPRENTFVVENVTVLVLGASQWHLKILVARDNNLERLDLQLIMPNSSIEQFDLSNCKIQFINPQMFSTLTSIRVINLGNNFLYKMVQENMPMFGELFRSMKDLIDINLSGNLLREIPANTFDSNSNLEILDLSSNMLDQITFSLEALSRLKYLNLRNNAIKLLSSTSLDKLKYWLTNNSRASIDLRQNTLTCSKCQSLSFVRWLSLVNNYTETKCVNSDNVQVPVDESVVDKVENICNRLKLITGVTTAAISLAVIAIVLFLSARKYRRNKEYILAMEDRVRLIREGVYDHEFAVFLSYSSNDDDFVHEYVIEKLNEGLQRAVGETRELVCEGDQYFHLGRPIHDEISLLLKRSSVGVVVLSDNYCQSVHCRNEFDQMFMLQKPVILMLKGHVNTDLMTPLIKDVYNTRTRIHWYEEKGQYVLKTTWNHICTCILELVDR